MKKMQHIIAKILIFALLLQNCGRPQGGKIDPTFNIDNEGHVSIEEGPSYRTDEEGNLEICSKKQVSNSCRNYNLEADGPIGDLDYRTFEDGYRKEEHITYTKSEKGIVYACQGAASTDCSPTPAEPPPESDPSTTILYPDHQAPESLPPISRDPNSGNLAKDFKSLGKSISKSTGDLTGANKKKKKKQKERRRLLAEIDDLSKQAEDTAKEIKQELDEIKNDLENATDENKYDQDNLIDQEIDKAGQGHNSGAGSTYNQTPPPPPSPNPDDEKPPIKDDKFDNGGDEGDSFDPNGKKLKRAKKYLEYVSSLVDGLPEGEEKENLEKMVAGAGAAFDAAEEAYSQGHEEEGDDYLNFGLNVLDVVVGFVPFAGEAADVCALFAGNNCITGEPLDDLDRAIIIGGLLTGGALSKAKKGRKAAELIDQMLKKSDELGASKKVPIKKVGDGESIGEKGLKFHEAEQKTGLNLGDVKNRYGDSTADALKDANTQDALADWGTSKDGKNQLLEHLQAKDENRLKTLENRAGLPEGSLTSAKSSYSNEVSNSIKNMDTLAKDIIKNGDSYRSGSKSVHWIEGANKPNDGIAVIVHDGKVQSLMPKSKKQWERDKELLK